MRDSYTRDKILFEGIGSRIRQWASDSARRTDSVTAICGLLALLLVAPNSGLAVEIDGSTRQAKPDYEYPGNPAFGAGLRGGAPAGGGCNVPTDASHSPLFGAEKFTQSLLRFEEFGTKPLKEQQYSGCRQSSDEAKQGYCADMPQPSLGGPSKSGQHTAYGVPLDGPLDTFLNQPLFPWPTQDANQNYPNPWQAAIEDEHTGPLQPLVAGAKFATVADGRPPGAQFGHQRWSEFFPRVYTQTAQAGARTNSGFRDGAQTHEYSAGEFGPSGLYYNTVHSSKALACGASTLVEASDSVNQAACEAVSNPLIAGGFDKMCTWDASQKKCGGTFDGTTANIGIRFHPRMPIQDHQALSTFDGTLPPKLLKSRYSEGVLFRHHNALPIKFESNRGFGNHFISTHMHNGHNPAESDGFAQAFYLPGQFYDYHWPMVLAGHDPIEGNRNNNPRATEKRASTPCDESAGEQILISYPSPLSDSSNAICDRGQRLAANATWNSKAGVYMDEGACGWRATEQTCDENGRIQIPGDWRETMSTLWFHDHMLDYTAQNVYKGNAAMVNIYSGLDPAREGWKCHYADPENNVNLCLPSGSGKKWGNRDYDVNLVMGGKAWGQDTQSYLGTTAPGNPAGEEPVDGLIQGQLWFNAFNTDGFLGDRMTVNWLFDPYMDVRARRYRFRLLNGHVSRFLRPALVVQRNDGSGEFPGKTPGVSYDRVPFHAVANDGNIMQHTVPFDGSKDLDGDGDLQEHNAILPTQAIAERWDIIVDFSENNPAGLAPGDKLYMVNLLEHKNGKRPQRSIPLGEVLSGAYAGEDPDAACDTVVDKFLELRIQSCTKADGSPAASCRAGGGAIASQQDRSMDPGLYLEGNTNGPDGKSLTMMEMPLILPEELEAAHHRTFVFGRAGATDAEPRSMTEAQGTNSPAPNRIPISSDGFLYEVNGEAVNVSEHHDLPVAPKLTWGVKTDDGDMVAADIHRTSAAPKLGDLEIWHIINGGGGWSHNVHIHFEEGRILTRNDETPPDWEKWARKDVYRVGRMDDSGGEVTFAIRFREFGGAFMEHCHNTQHEDHAMLVRWDIENPGQLKPFLTPEPQWNGCSYTESYVTPTARVQEGGADRAPEDVGNWKVREDFLKDGSAARLLCAVGEESGCSPGATGTAADTGSTTSTSNPSSQDRQGSDADNEPSARTDASDPGSDLNDEEPFEEETVGVRSDRRKKGSRRRGGRRGHSGGRNAQLEK